MSSAPSVKNDPKTIFGWCMYDWANSAFATTILAGLLPVYFARVVVGPEGFRIGETTYSAFTLWGFVVGFAALVTFISAPVLGAMADFARAKKRFLLAFAYTGALFTLLLFSCRTGDTYLTLFLFLIAEVSYVAANVFYDAFLPQIASEDQMDRISGRGYSYGYVGGGIQFALALALVLGHERLGLSIEAAMRIGIALAGIWWAGFTLFTAKYLFEARSSEPLPDSYRSWPRVLAYAAIALSRTLRTTRRAGRFRHLVLFLVAFMLYNDGIQTVILMATSYGTDELQLSPATLMATILVIQVVAAAGALIFSRLAGRIGTKRAVMVTLVLWSGVVTYAYFIKTAAEFLALGAIVGVVMGGSQALSRSYYGQMIPESASAEFYGFFTVFSKFSSIWGPFVLAAIRQLAGSARLAIVSLVVFFVGGLILLSLVNEEKAREAKAAGAF